MRIVIFNKRFIIASDSLKYIPAMRYRCESEPAFRMPFFHIDPHCFIKINQVIVIIRGGASTFEMSDFYLRIIIIGKTCIHYPVAQVNIFTIHKEILIQ